MLKVAIVVHQFPQLSETFIINQITALLDAGVDVRIFSYYHPLPSQQLHPQFVAYNLQERVHYGTPMPVNRARKYMTFVNLFLQDSKRHGKVAKFKSLNFLKYGNKALNLYYFYKSMLFSKQNEFDIIHCHFGPIGQDMVQLRRMGLISGKIITSFHGYDYQRNDVLAEHDNYKLLFQYGDGFVANSNFTLQRLINLGCDPGKASVIPVSTSTKIFEQSIARSSSPPSFFRLLTVARLEEVKGIEYSIRAAYLLKHSYGIKFTYNIVGIGSLEDDLKKLVEETGLTDNVIFHGARTQDFIVSLLAESDVFLLPGIVTEAGIAEAQGLVLLEAQLAGVPVVASRVGGIQESLADGETGMLVPEKNPEAIASTLITLHRQPELRRQMGEKGKIFVQENFDQEVLCKRMVSLYTTIRASV